MVEGRRIGLLRWILIVFAIHFGIAAVLIGDKGKGLIGVADSAAETMYKLTTIVMWFAPLGVFSLIAGIDVILDMGRTCPNVTGDVACTAAVAYSEGEFSPETVSARQAEARVRTA